jgi:hypothetical protein
MMTRSWIRQLFTRTVTRTIRKAPRRVRPALEALEERCVPSTFTVINTLDDGSVGSLRYEIGQANSNPGANTVAFDSTVFNTPLTITLTGSPLELSNTGGAETITGPAAGVTVSGGGTSRVFQVDSGVTASLSGLTISGGSTTGLGGGLFNEGGTTTLTNCTVSGNSAGVAGGITNSGVLALTDSLVTRNTADIAAGIFNTGTLTLTDSTVSDNTAHVNDGGIDNSNGTVTLLDSTVSGNAAGIGNGGIANYGGTVALLNSTVSGNTAQGAGGIGNYGGTFTLTNCAVSGNSASGSGGGLFTYAGTTTLTNCTVSGNSAFTGGGLFDGGGTTTLTNCTVSGNSASFFADGGGLYDSGGTTTLINCTVSGNSAGVAGGLNGTATLTNTIVAGNTASGSGPDALGTFASLGNNLIGETDGSSGWVGSDLKGTIAQPLNPLLAPLGDYGGPTQTMALLPGSPAIDAGNNHLIPAGVTTDHRGLPRIVNGTVDIGAFESSGFTIAVNSGSGQSTDVSTAFSARQVVTVTANNPSEPVAGGLVTFTAPTSGASATLRGSPATISATGRARVRATANGNSGSYTVSATASGSPDSASFSLTNKPTITVPDAQTAYEKVDQTISGISIGDDPSVTLTVILDVSHGTLTLGTTSGLTVTGTGSGSVSLSGTTADLNAALATVVYRGSSDYSGGDTLSITTADGSVSATPASLAIDVVSLDQELADL